MASSVREVRDFLRSSRRRASPPRSVNLRSWTAFAGRALKAWDVGVLCRAAEARAARALSEEALRPYFPLPRVLSGLFAVAERLYGVRIAERSDVEIYHPDVRFFDILNADGSRRGSFFVDLYARAKKRGGAWMDECVGRKRLDAPRRCRSLTWSATSRRRGRAAVAADALRSRDDVPRVRPWPAPHADARRLPEHRRHQRRAVGCRRAAEPVHGELRVARRKCCR